MDRIEAIKTLLEAEAKERWQTYPDRDAVNVLYELVGDISQGNFVRLVDRARKMNEKRGK